MENEYTALLDRYPEFISLDELRRVCRISPKSARYLIENGIIPAIDTGKMTWRYKIAMLDVITYLRLREKVGSMIPPGAVTSHKKNRGKGLAASNRKSYAQMVSPGCEQEVADYFNYLYSDCEDILTTNIIADMTGLDRSTIMKLAKSGHIKSLEQKPKYLIPKQYLLEFVVTRRFLEAKSKSPLFEKILGGFEIWRNAKS